MWLAALSFKTAHKEMASEAEWEIRTQPDSTKALLVVWDWVTVVEKRNKKLPERKKTKVHVLLLVRNLHKLCKITRMPAWMTVYHFFHSKVQQALFFFSFAESMFIVLLRELRIRHAEACFLGKPKTHLLFKAVRWNYYTHLHSPLLHSDTASLSDESRYAQWEHVL